MLYNSWIEKNGLKIKLIFSKKKNKIRGLLLLLYIIKKYLFVFLIKYKWKKFIKISLEKSKLLVIIVIFWNKI